MCPQRSDTPALLMEGSKRWNGYIATETPLANESRNS